MTEYAYDMYGDVIRIFYVIFQKDIKGIGVGGWGLHFGLPGALEPTAWHPQLVWQWTLTMDILCLG